MGFTAVRAVSADVNRAWFGLDATVTRPGLAAIAGVKVIWIVTPELAPLGMDLQGAVRQRVLSIPRGAVPTLPRRTVVSVAEYEDGAVLSWSVDEVVSSDYDRYLAVMVPL